MAGSQAMERCNFEDLYVLSASVLSLDLSRKGICKLPELQDCEKLECLYIEGNELSTLPESLFISCPNLRWLDLRNNHLTSIPPSIEKLRYLRTLLLEGNRIISLPPQLGRLRHLTGLNLSNNPLENPPKHIVQKGTKVVLQHLLKLLREYEEDSEQMFNGESNTANSSPTHIESNPSNETASHHHIDVNSMQRLHVSSKLGLPLPLLSKQIPLHAHPQSPCFAIKRKHFNKERSVNSPECLVVNKKCVKKMETSTKIHNVTQGIKKQPPPPKLSAEEKLEISVTIEKRKAVETLKVWREEARELKRKQDQQAIDRQNAFRDVRETELRTRINKHMLELATLRKQAGLISSPSDELLQAEKKLAEALVWRKDIEGEKSREYRLSAFTGDLPG
ncbi:leucine-rich repeat-containing protein 40-like isoform X3 [Halichondria panicea]|uniref:leucine-rich repeat-containing protein 40-like isoform X3 n=1 Tax=Halichondria panicea TaxID=6063 RepID=UPI00312BB783